MLHFSGFQCPWNGSELEKYEYWACILLRNKKKMQKGHILEVNLDPISHNFQNLVILVSTCVFSKGPCAWKIPHYVKVSLFSWLLLTGNV